MRRLESQIAQTTSMPELPQLGKIGVSGGKHDMTSNSRTTMELSQKKRREKDTEWHLIAQIKEVLHPVWFHQCPMVGSRGSLQLLLCVNPGRTAPSFRGRFDRPSKYSRSAASAASTEKRKGSASQPQTQSWPNPTLVPIGLVPFGGSSLSNWRVSGYAKSMNSRWKTQPQSTVSSLLPTDYQ